MHKNKVKNRMPRILLFSYEAVRRDRPERVVPPASGGYVIIGPQAATPFASALVPAKNESWTKCHCFSSFIYFESGNVAHMMKQKRTDKHTYKNKSITYRNTKTSMFYCSLVKKDDAVENVVPLLSNKGQCHRIILCIPRKKILRGRHCSSGK